MFIEICLVFLCSFLMVSYIPEGKLDIYQPKLVERWFYDIGYM